MARVAAGWVWLLAFVAAVWMCVILLTGASGRAPGVDQMRVLILDPVGAAQGLSGATESVRWITPWWQWLLPFTASTVAYLAVTTLFLATPHSIPWGIGLWFLLVAVAENADKVAVVAGVLDSVGWTVGFTDGLRAWVTLPSGDRALAWRALPSPGTWLASTTMWVGLGSGAVWAALSRPRDH